jgi:hypothetical protein
MKYRILVIICTIGLLMSGCYDRDIIDSKPGEPIEPVTDLTYMVSDDNVILSWGLPSEYPADIIQPVSILVKVYENDILINTITIPDAPVSYTYNPYDNEKPYRFIIKVVGNVDTTDPYLATTRYSPGAFVKLD